MSKIAVIGLVGNSAFLSVDQFHKGGETVVAKDIHFEPGGKGFNQAVAAARFGKEVSFLGAVGKDYAEEVKAFSKAENINAFLAIKDVPSAYASIITNSNGDTRVTVFGGASLCVSDLSPFEEEIKNADVLLINNEVPEDVNEKAVELAKKYGTEIIMNPAPMKELSQYIKNNVSLFTPNEFEAFAIENKDNLIITLGEKGCFVKSLNNFVNSIKVTPVDTTGAGDTFNGVLASLLAEGKPLCTAVQYATVASGLSVTKKYAVSSIPYFKDVEKYIAENGLPKIVDK